VKVVTDMVWTKRTRHPERSEGSLFPPRIGVMIGMLRFAQHDISIPEVAHP